MQGIHLFLLCVILTVAISFCNAQVCSGCYTQIGNIRYTCSDCNINYNNGVCTCGDGSPCQKCQPPAKGIIVCILFQNTNILLIETVSTFPCPKELQVCGRGGSCCDTQLIAPGEHQCTTWDKNQYTVYLSNTTFSNSCQYEQVSLCTGG